MHVKSNKSTITRWLFFVLFLTLSIPLSTIVSLMIFSHSWLAAFLIPGCLLISSLLFLTGLSIRKKSFIRISHKILFIPYSIWILVFVSYFVWWYASEYFGIRLTSDQIRFPNDKISGVFADNNNIYIYSKLFNRLQIFDTKGRFVRGWFICVGGTITTIETKEDSELSIQTQAPTFTYHYDDTGKIIDKATNLDNMLHNQQNLASTEDGDGNRYKAKESFYPNIIKISPNGQEEVFIKEPFGIWIVSGFPGLFFCVMLFFIERLSRTFLEKDYKLA